MTMLFGPLDWCERIHSGEHRLLYQSAVFENDRPLVPSETTSRLFSTKTRLPKLKPESTNVLGKTPPGSHEGGAHDGHHDPDVKQPEKDTERHFGRTNDIHERPVVPLKVEKYAYHRGSFRFECSQ